MTTVIPNNNPTTQITITTLIDSFKHSFSSLAAVQQIQLALSANEKTDETITIQPYAISDGGEGFIDAMSLALGVAPIQHTITGPLQEPIQAQYLYNPAAKLVVMESAQGVGIQSVPKSSLNPSIVSSFGVGQQLRYVLSQHQQREGDDEMGGGIDTIILGLGGTASVDCGLGLLYGLLGDGIECTLADGSLTKGGFDVCLDKIVGISLPRPPRQHPTSYTAASSTPVTTPTTTSSNHLNWSILHQLMSRTKIILASDVTNPLLGVNGAAYVFGPQKGLGMDMRQTWDQGISSFSSLLLTTTSSPLNLPEQPGCGAAGGIGFVLYCLWYYYWSVVGNGQDDGGHVNNNTETNNNLRNNNIIMRSGFELLCDYTPIIDSVRSRCYGNGFQEQQQPQQQKAAPSSSSSSQPTFPLLNQIIITGEGRFDSQSLDGKVVDRVCNLIAKGEGAEGVDNHNHCDGLSTNVNSTNTISRNNIPVVVLCGSNGFDNNASSGTITNPNLVNFPQLSSSILVGDADSRISYQLGQLNIVKIIDINDSRFHPRPKTPMMTTETTTTSTTLATTTLEYKIAHGLDNLTKVGLFLRQLLDQTATLDDDEKDGQQPLSIHNHIIRFITALREID